MLSWSFQNYLASQAAKTVRFDGSDSVFWHGSALGIAARGHVDHPQVWQIQREHQIPKAYCSRVAGIFGISDGISDISYPIHFSSRYSVYTGFRTSLFVCDWDLVRAWYLLIVGEGSSACWFFCENYVGSWAWNLQRLRRLAVRQPSSTCDTLCAVQESQSPRSFKTKSVDTNETSDTREMIAESGLGRKLQVPGPCGDWERNRKNWNPMKPIVPSCSIVFQTVHI